MLISAQIRAGRSLLGWPARVLAEKAGVHLTTVQRLESREGPLKHNARAVQRIRHSLETAGVAFTQEDGPGVRLRKSLLTLAVAGLSPHVSSPPPRCPSWVQTV